MELLFKTTIVAVGLLSQQFATAAIFSFDTSSAAGWTATAGGAVNATPFVVSGIANAGGQTVLSITSDVIDTGTFLSGGSLANFTGFWTARYSFMLPSNAYDVQLNFSKLFSDDRAVMMLNGTIISSAGIIGPGGSLNGFMVMTDGGPSQAYTFAGPSGSVSGSVSTGFVSGLNTLDFIVNNTGTDLAGALKPSLAWNDGTEIAIAGSVLFSVPEPSCASLAILALGGVFLRARKARAKN